MIKIDDWVIEKGEKSTGESNEDHRIRHSNAGNCDMRSERRTDDTDHSGNTQCGVCQESRRQWNLQKNFNRKN